MAKKPSRPRKTTNNNKSYEEKNSFRLASIQPITENQHKTFDLYDAEKNLLLYGTAGTGKTFISLYLALEEVLSGKSTYNKIIIVRSVVPTREMGFLPGSADEKSAVYEAPYNAVCTELLGRGDAYGLMKKKGIIEFMTSSFVRGITLKDCVVIVDEFQNMVDDELHSVITRVGDNCRVIFSGDCRQNDLKREATGFHKFLTILSTMNSFGVVEFGIEDIVRSATVKEYIIKRERYEESHPVQTPVFGRKAAYA